MYVVTVEFILKSDHAAAFKTRVLQQAADSLSKERGCQVFDVCIDPGRAERIFLYEVYDDESAFKAHLASEHFRSFDADTSDWVSSKRVDIFSRLAATRDSNA